MLLDSILNHLQTRRTPGQVNHGYATRRLRFETFEDRRMLSFTPASSFPVGAEPQAVVAADFNNDGWLDLVTANAGSNSVSVLLGNANGTFQPAITSAAAETPRSLAVGDFNADGNLDLAMVNDYAISYFGNPDPDPSNGVSVMLGNGDGSFQPPSNVPLYHGAKATSLAVGDFNADGTMDLAVASVTDPYYPGDVYEDRGLASVLLGHGDGSFHIQHSKGVDRGYGISRPTPAAVAVAVADFNGDGNQDFVVGTRNFGFDTGDTVEEVAMLLGDGQGNIASESWWRLDHGWSMAAGDLNGDLKIDLVTADGNDVNVRLGDGAGGFQPPPGGLSYAAGNQPTSVVLGDFDADGSLDIATANYGSNDVSILRGHGDGTFAPPEQFAAGLGPNAMAAGDFNGDGWLDVATANANGNNVSVLINDRSWAPTSSPVSISVSDASVTEGKRGIKYLTFTVSLSAASTSPVTVNYATQNGSATAGSDYQAQSGTLSFAAGETTKTVRIAIYGDSTIEPDEWFQLVLSDPSGNAVISDPLGIGTIVNDDVLRGNGKKK